MRHILFYSDIDSMGGHEIMSLELIKAMLVETDYQISLAYSGRNEHLRRAAREIPGLQTFELPFSAVKREYLFATLMWQRKRTLSKVLNRARPDIVISIQPRVELCTLPARIKHERHVKVLSYVPFAHQPDSKFEGAFRAAVRRTLLPHLYALFDGFITITESARRDIVAQCPIASVAVVENAVRLQKQSRFSRKEARIRLGLPLESTVLGMVGRIDFAQKGHDTAVKHFAQYRPTQDTRLLIVGSGTPDATFLRTMVTRLGLDAVVTIRDWMEDVPDVLAAIDCLFLPSRFEGMPLVMLEAILCGVPVAGTNCDGMAEVLPPSWLFDRSNPDSIRSAICHALADRSTPILENLQEHLRTHFSLKGLGRRMAVGIESL